MAAAAAADHNLHHHGDTLGLRCVAMAVIAVVSLAGCLLPAVIYYRLHHRKQPHLEPEQSLTERLPVFSLLKCFAAGVILGVGYVVLLAAASVTAAAACLI